jgi:cytochrome c5
MTTVLGIQYKNSHSRKKTNPKEHHMKRILLLIVLVIILSACSSTAPAVKPADAPAPAAPAAEQPTTAAPAAVQAATTPAASPAMDGAALMEDRCSVCHSTNKIKQAPRSKGEWDQTVSRMINKGAQLNDAEKAALVDYLAATYGK